MPNRPGGPTERWWEPPDDYWEQPLAGKRSSQRRKRKKKDWPRITRDGVIFGVGLSGIFHEAIIRDGEPRDTLLILFATMIGLPAFLRMDDKRERSPGQD